MTTQSRSGEKIRVAVITGHHPYDVVGLQALFRSLPEIDAYPQNLEDFVTDTGGSRGGYEVVVFYNYHLPTPGNEQFPLGGNVREVLEELGETEQGIFVLHHAILAYPDWPLWQQIVGDIRMDRSRPVLQEQSVRIQNVAPGHPITEGVTSFKVLDETYPAGEPGDGSEVLLVTDHPASMRTMAWTRTYRNARVFCYQSGHDRLAFDNPGFQTVVTRGIQWCARRS